MVLSRDGSTSLFSDSPAGTLRLLMYIALAAVLMVLDHRNGWLQQARYASALVIEPVYRLAGLPSAGVEAARTAFADRSRLIEDNRRLREALLIANARLNRMAAVDQQNQRLKRLLDVQRTLGMNAQLARVIDIDLDPFRHRIVLNAGRRQGVRPGQAVIDARGIVGQVVEALPDTSVVLLITDPSHAIPVTVARTGLRAIADGSAAGDRLELPNVPISADLRVGDQLLSSGLGGRFPAGFPVGTVTAVRPDRSGMYARAWARPAADLGRVGEVLLLRDLADPVGPPAPAPASGPPASLKPAAAAPAASRSAGAAP